MTEPQIWTIIGLFAATVFSMLGMITGWFTHIVRTEIGSVRTEVRTEIGSVRTEVRTEIGSLRREMTSGFESVDRRLDGLDRDVQALTRHVFHRPE